MNLPELIKGLYFNFRLNHYGDRAKRLILGYAKRDQLIREMEGLEMMVDYKQGWESGNKMERYLGMEILVDMADADRLELE